MDQKIEEGSRPLVRNIIFSIVSLIIFLLLTEIVIRVVYFQFKHSTLGIVVAFNDLNYQARLALSKYKIGSYDIPEGLFAALYSEKGKSLLEKFQQIYEQEFLKIYNGVNKVKSKFIVLYIPFDDYREMKNISTVNVMFFKQLCKKYEVDFVDLTDTFMQYPTNYVTLLPEDGHLSRFGNILVAEELSNSVMKYDNYRSDHKFSKRPDLLGDLRPDSKTIWVTDFRRPYRVITNGQGLRMSYDLEFPKQKQRVLILGDSFTFGQFLPNQDTYPELLNKKYPAKEFVNAGVAGYTIDNEAGLFIDRAIYTEPDITILQVLDNDLYDLFYFRKNTQDRQRKVSLPSILEKKLMEEVRTAHRKNTPMGTP
jgi:hypothetical protein